MLKKQSSELVTVEALFIPSDVRLSAMSAAQRMKLAFILHTVYGIRDFTYQVLDGIDNELAHSYLLS
ncbi:hypothetical protein R0K30_22975, partial [Bacillus sp. SIMBA_154]|uniref:hypothetical protein n=1 Tax=Bacillus sp. SIMBA_154 TaxID=3080859 RepID=UPI0039784458